MTTSSNSDRAMLKLNNRLAALVTVRELVEEGVLLEGEGYKEWDKKEGSEVLDCLAELELIQRQLEV